MYYNMNSTKSSNGRVDIINKTQAPDLSNLFAMKDASKGSSIIYEFKKQSSPN